MTGERLNQIPPLTLTERLVREHYATEDTAEDIGEWVVDVADSRTSKQFTTVLIDGRPYRVTVERLPSVR